MGHHHVGVGGVKEVLSPHPSYLQSSHVHLSYIYWLIFLGTVFVLLFRVLLPKLNPHIRKQLGKRKHSSKKREEMYNDGRLLNVIDA